MAQLPWVANTDENKETLDDYSPLPSGTYNAMIVKSEFKKTKAGDGMYLQLNVKVIEGDYKGRMVFERLNLNNPNPVAVEIANKTLNTICLACNAFGVEDSEELHGIPMTIKVRYKPETDQNPASNDVTYYGPYEGENIDDPAETGEETEEETSQPKPKPKVMPKVKPKAKPAAKAKAKKLPWEK